MLSFFPIKASFHNSEPTPNCFAKVFDRFECLYADTFNSPLRGCPYLFNCLPCEGSHVLNGSSCGRSIVEVLQLLSDCCKIELCTRVVSLQLFANSCDFYANAIERH